MPAQDSQDAGAQSSADTSAAIRTIYRVSRGRQLIPLIIVLVPGVAMLAAWVFYPEPGRAGYLGATLFLVGLATLAYWLVRHPHLVVGEGGVSLHQVAWSVSFAWSGIILDDRQTRRLVVVGAHVRGMGWAVGRTLVEREGPKPPMRGCLIDVSSFWGPPLTHGGVSGAAPVTFWTTEAGGGSILEQDLKRHVRWLFS